MKHNLWYQIVRWLIQHSYAATTYVIEMRNEVADSYEYQCRQCCGAKMKGGE